MQKQFAYRAVDFARYIPPRALGRGEFGNGGKCPFCKLLPCQASHAPGVSGNVISSVYRKIFGNFTGIYQSVDGRWMCIIA